MNLEVRILEELWAHFAEVRIVKDFGEKNACRGQLEVHGLEKKAEATQREGAEYTEEERTWR
jgi:hypothetical protein